VPEFYSPRQLLAKIQQCMSQELRNRCDRLLHRIMSAFGTRRTWRLRRRMSAFGGIADISIESSLADLKS